MPFRSDIDLLGDGERGAAKQAEAHLMRVWSLAHEQQAAGWSLRAATSLARLWLAQGRYAKARKLLAPVHGRFTEGFDTADLRAARTLLDQPALAAPAKSGEECRGGRRPSW